MGMSSSYDFGFIPSKVADDCDSVDVLVLMGDFTLGSLLSRCAVRGS